MCLSINYCVEIMHMLGIEKCNLVLTLVTSKMFPAPTQPLSQKENITPKDTPPSIVPTPPPTSPPLESWAHALERARADGSIQRQLMREKMAEERRKKLAMLDSKRKTTNAEQTVIAESVDELGTQDICTTEDRLRLNTERLKAFLGNSFTLAFSSHGGFREGDFWGKWKFL